MTSEEQDVMRRTSIDTLMTTAFHLTHRMHARGYLVADPITADLRAQRDLIVAEVTRRVYHEVDVEDLARDICDTYYLTVDPRPERMMGDAYSKITEKTREHWRAQAALLLEKGWQR